jgi:hypothetical protein
MLGAGAVSYKSLRLYGYVYGAKVTCSKPREPGGSPTRSVDGVRPGTDPFVFSGTDPFVTLSRFFASASF